jgi:hypothetical protein
MTVKTLRQAMMWSCLVWGVGCGAPENDLSQEEQPLAQAAQGLTITKTFSWPAKAANKNCRFGDTAAGNQAPRNSYASGRMEETVSVTGLAGQRIVSLTLRTPSGTSSSFQYDDVMLINYRNSMLMASDRRVADYSAGSGAGTTGTTPVTYVWSNILNKDIANQTAQTAWCATGASSCLVPATQTVGTLDVQIPNFKGQDVLNYPSAPDTRTFTLVTIGDNDDGTFNSGSQTQDLDCTHGEVKVELIITTEPAVVPPSATYTEIPISQLTALHPGCTEAQVSSTLGFSKQCIAAAHRYCRNRGYEAGAPSEVNAPNIGVSCFRATAYTNVNIAELTAHHSGCNSTSSIAFAEYPYECAAAASRYCRAKGFASGLLQEILLPITGVSCVSGPPKAEYRPSVPFSTWSSYHPGCPVNPGTVDASVFCRAAARRYCMNTSSTGAAGLVVEQGGSVQDLVCINK